VPQRFGAAALVVIVAYVLQTLLWPLIPPSPHLLFYPAVFLAARLGGAGAGYLATALSTVGIAYGFLPPEGLLVVEKASDALDLGIFFAVGLGISTAVGRLREAILRERRQALEARTAKESTDATWSMIAHDLRQPLSVITMGSNELGRRKSPEEIEKVLRLIQRSTDRARELVDNALDAMRAKAGKLGVEPAPCDPRELCERAVDAVALVASRKGVSVESDVANGRAVMGDEARLAQVLVNLLGNAVKFTPAGGTVSLYADEDETEQGMIFAVRDTGPGIPADEIGSIFSKFWSGSTGGGTGLGLWIASAIAEAHGARLDVKSRLGVGTTFSFVLPFADLDGRKATEGADAPPSSRAFVKGMRARPGEPRSAGET
jgi:signal transduction histidine kinase